ncbi:MAG: CpaE-like family protein [Nocardiopsaceae bacterium]|nr:CpaE-like family protein [Nocardiopsaceae bacterium]
MPDPHPPRPLLVTDDPDLLDDLLRLAAAAAVETTVAHSAALAGRDWPRAPLIVVGTDLLPSMVELDPAPHTRVVVAARGDTPYARPDSPAWEAALRIGARTVLSLPDDEARLADLFADSAETRPGRSPVISVIGGRGGAGASLFAIAMALAGRRAGLCTALIDADPLGGGLDLLIGQEHAQGTRWGDLLAREGRMNWSALSTALPAARGCTLLTWEHGPAEAIPPPAMRAVLSSATRGTDLVVADLPRALDAAAEEALHRTTTTLLIVPADLHAVMAAHRLTPRLLQHTGDLRLVVRGSCPDLPAATIAHALDLPLAGDLPAEPGLARTLDRGDTPAGRRTSPLAGFADEFLARLHAEHPSDEQDQGQNRPLLRRGPVGTSADGKSARTHRTAAP